MAPERDLAGDLAEEIRAAVAAASPAAPPRPAAGGSVDEGEDVRVSLTRALEYVTPAIPSAVRLSRSKRLVLRALRFLWRDQASFNALLLEAGNALAGKLTRTARGLEEGLGELRRESENSRMALTELRAALGERIGALDERIGKWSAGWERRDAILGGRLAMLEAGGPVPPAEGPRPAPTQQLPPGVYSLFEERFRGSLEEVADKQRFYLPFLDGIPGPVLDVGCGRGEFLTLLRERGIKSSGVEINPIAVAACLEAGLEVEQGDGLAVLAGRPEGSLGAVVAFQVVEHWSPETTFAFLRESQRALAPGGIIVLETINTDSLFSLRAFFLDPSHVRPVPPETLRFFAEAAGFVQARIEYRAPLDESDRLEESSENDIKLNRLLFGPQDYALVASTPRAERTIGRPGETEAALRAEQRSPDDPMIR